jgi:site-specific DNA-methyltransferase (adenine-specific)
MENNKIIQGDCLEVNDIIKSGSVDLIICDLPYGIMQPNHNGICYKKMYKDNLKWDYAIEPKLIYNIAKRILRKNGKMVLFGQEPYVSKLITNSTPSVPYSFKMIWKKDTFGSHLKCNIAPLGYFEEILVFNKPSPKLDFNKMNPLREIMLKYVEKYGKNYIINLFIEEGRYTSNESARVHASYKFGFGNGCRIDLMTESLFNYLRDFIKFNHTYQELSLIYNAYHEKEKEKLNLKYPSTFNLWEGKKFKSNILEYKKDYEGLHPTQKPIALIEDLVRTFSNENDLVVDLTAGSGTVGVACEKANRNYILIEKEPKYVDIARKRIQEFKNSQTDSLFGNTAVNSI